MLMQFCVSMISILFFCLWGFVFYAVLADLTPSQVNADLFSLFYLVYLLL
jgi:hypothetical protein